MPILSNMQKLHAGWVLLDWEHSLKQEHVLQRLRDPARTDGKISEQAFFEWVKEQPLVPPLPNAWYHPVRVGRGFYIVGVGPYVSTVRGWDMGAHGIRASQELSILASSIPADLQSIVGKYEAQGAEIEVREHQNSQESYSTLEGIRVPKESRNKGIGSAFMQEFVTWADAHQQTIFLHPTTDFGATSVARLRRFYSRFGFKRNMGRNKDFRSWDAMVRQPKKPTAALKPDAINGVGGTFYHGTAHDFKKLKPNSYGIIWLGDRATAKTYADDDEMSLSFTDPNARARVFPVKLQPGIKVLDLRNGSDPLVVEFKKVYTRFGAKGDSHHLLEQRPLGGTGMSPVEWLREHGVDAVICTDNTGYKNGDHNSFAVLNPAVIRKEGAKPPEYLYHGTTIGRALRIATQGLRGGPDSLPNDWESFKKMMGGMEGILSMSEEDCTDDLYDEDGQFTGNDGTIEAPMKSAYFDFLKVFKGLGQEFPIYRGISLEWGIKDLKKKDFGTSWSWLPDHAYPFWGDRGRAARGVQFTFRATIKASDVDWPSTAIANLLYNDEAEIRLKPGVPINITGWSDCAATDTTQWKEPLPAWKRVTAASNQTPNKHGAPLTASASPLSILASLKTISKQEAIDRKLLGPVYHGTTSDARTKIDAEGFKPSTGDDGRNGYNEQEYARGVPAPIHHLGFGVYFTTSKTIFKKYNQDSTRGMVEYYLDVPNLETINFGAPNTMMKWWVANGYDPVIAKTKRMRATQEMTDCLADQYDAVWYKGKSMHSLLDGDQVVVFDPERIYRVDPNLAKPGDVGATVIRKSDGMKGKLVGSREIPEEYRGRHNGCSRYLEVKWQKGGTEWNVFDTDVEFPTKKAAAAAQTYLPTAENPNFMNWFSGSKVVDKDGQPLRVYRGDFRGDRMGTTFKVNRTNSGRFYFTDDPEIASKYSEDKPDYAHAEENCMYPTWFRFPGYRYPRERRTPDLQHVWHRLTRAEQERVKQVALTTTQDSDGNIVFGAKSPINGIDGMTWDAQQNHGNWLMAMQESWLAGGTLFDKPEKFGTIIQKCGIPYEYDCPHDARSTVTAVYLRILNPLDTEGIPQRVADRFHEMAKTDRSRAKPIGYDAWDKGSTTIREWVQKFDEDQKDGTTWSWTTIPEKITQALQSLGYDGIKDSGGKMGGAKHTVWIAFTPGQIKSATGNSGNYDPTKDSIVASVHKSGAESSLEAPAWLHKQYKEQGVNPDLVEPAWKAMQENRQQLQADNLQIAKEHNFEVTPEGNLVLYHGTRSGSPIRKSQFLRPGSFLSAIRADAERYAHAAQRRGPAETLRLEVFPGYGSLRGDGYFISREPIPVKVAKQAALPKIDSDVEWAQRGLERTRAWTADEAKNGVVSDAQFGRLLSAAFNYTIEVKFEGDAAVASPSGTLRFRVGGAYNALGDGTEPVILKLSPGLGRYMGEATLGGLSWWEDFTKQVTGVLVHEHTHALQFNRWRTKKNKQDPSGAEYEKSLERFDKGYQAPKSEEQSAYGDVVKYLGNEVEIAAHARQAVSDLKAKGMEAREIHIWIRRKGGWGILAQKSHAFQSYYRIYLFNPEVGVPIFRKFLTNMLRALAGEDTSPISREDHELGEELSPSYFSGKPNRWNLDRRKPKRKAKLLDPKGVGTFGNQGGTDVAQPVMGRKAKLLRKRATAVFEDRAQFLPHILARPDAEELYVHGSARDFSNFPQPDTERGQLIFLEKVSKALNMKEFLGDNIYLCKIKDAPRYEPTSEPAKKPGLFSRKPAVQPPARLEYDNLPAVVPQAVKAGYKRFTVFDARDGKTYEAVSDPQLIQIVEYCPMDWAAQGTRVASKSRAIEQREAA